ncbi:MAG TPA: FAD-dependent oxidoreductase [Nakamurella sp.]|nr:FAD-dependent oxidoreductase [Nakamurella sp.]
MGNVTSMVIVGGGLAAAKAAETLRGEGFDGDVVVITAEDVPPYERPPLSKGVLTGSDADDVIFVHDEQWYRDQKIDLREGVRATAVDRAGRTVALSDGSTVGYDKLLLATGSAPRKLRAPGADLDGVHYLRTKRNSDALKQALSAGDKRVVVVGAGWIGLDVASAARGYHNEVTVIEPQPAPLRAALGDELGGMFADLHREHGVDLRLGTGVTEILGDGTAVTGVRTDGGLTVPADLVVVGVGARPMDELAVDAGLAVDNGVLVDAALRTSDENIYAAGDVANAEHPVLGRRIRVEHWANALNQGPAAAKSMLGQQVGYDHIPYFYTDQYDLGMEFTGDLGGEPFDRIVYRGNREGREFIVFWTAAGRVLAGMNVNVWDVADDIAALVRSGRAVDLAKLADPEVPLAEV